MDTDQVPAQGVNTEPAKVSASTCVAELALTRRHKLQD